MSTPSLAVRRRRGGRGLYKSKNSALQKSVGNGHALKKGKKLPEYLEVPEVAALMNAHFISEFPRYAMIESMTLP